MSKRRLARICQQDNLIRVTPEIFCPLWRATLTSPSRTYHSTRACYVTPVPPPAYSMWRSCVSLTVAPAATCGRATSSPHTMQG